jgi:hypothetical protein
MQAREEVLIAEGSDWFWWYGDDRSSEHDAEFDDLFRRHLRNAYRLLGKPVPDELFATNISTGIPTSAEMEPVALLTPVLDGEETSYFEWLGAGSFTVREAGGTMHQADRRLAWLRLAQFGFDRERFYVRLDGIRPPHELLAEGCDVFLEFLHPPGVRVGISGRGSSPAATIWERREEDGQTGWLPRLGTPFATAAAGTLLELGIPLSSLAPLEGDLQFFVAIRGADGNEIERHPADRPIVVALPDARFDAWQWRV